MNSSGSTANSKEFGSREQAIENQYALQKVISSSFYICFWIHSFKHKTLGSRTIEGFKRKVRRS